MIADVPATFEHIQEDLPEELQPILDYLKIHLLVELDAVVGENQDSNIPCGTAMTELERDCHALTTTARGGTAGCKQVLEHITQISGCSLMF